MIDTTCPDAIGWDQLVDYTAGELDPAAEGRLEEHMFACEACSRALEQVQALGAGIAAAMRAHRLTTAVTQPLLEEVQVRGARIRQYRLDPGETVACTAGPDDSYVAVRLAGPFGAGTGMTLNVDVLDLATGEHRQQQARDVPVDTQSSEIVLLVPGDVVRAYPRSRWTMELRSEGDASFGPYTLDHTPWEQLPASERLGSS